MREFLTKATDWWRAMSGKKRMLIVGVGIGLGCAILLRACT